MKKNAICNPYNLSMEVDLTSEQFVNQVKIYRVKFGLTQLELANMVGCSDNTISAIENGSSCSVCMALRLACVFSCSVDDLFQTYYVVRIDTASIDEELDFLYD